MGAKERRIVYDIKLRPDGWIEVIEGVFPFFAIVGRKRLLLRNGEYGAPMVVIDHPFDVAYVLPKPVYIYAGQHWKIELMEFDLIL